MAQALLDDNYETEAALILGDPAGFAMIGSSGDATPSDRVHPRGHRSDRRTRSRWTLGSYYTAGDLDGTSRR